MKRVVLFAALALVSTCEARAPKTCPVLDAASVLSAIIESFEQTKVATFTREEIVLILKLDRDGLKELQK